MTPEEEGRFRSYPGGPDRGRIHNELRAAARNFAVKVTEHLPPGTPERDDAMRHIHLAVMWANWGVARTFIPEGE